MCFCRDFNTTIVSVRAVIFYKTKRRLRISIQRLCRFEFFMFFLDHCFKTNFNTTIVSVRAGFLSGCCVSVFYFNTTIVSVRVCLKPKTVKNILFQYNDCVGSSLKILLIENMPFQISIQRLCRFEPLL